MTAQTAPENAPLTLDDLRSAYLDLVNHQLPAKASRVTMPVRLNHCFGRIILDNLFGDCWYGHLSRRRPAYQQLTADQLERAIAIGQAMLRDPATSFQLNQNSLVWRGKVPCPAASIF